PFTISFPHANICELIAPDILHQIIKGTFKDHLVSWVEAYLKKHYKSDFETVLADIDHWCVEIEQFITFFTGLWFKQWMGNDSKALMKCMCLYSRIVGYFPAIVGYVPDQMVQA
ncbi:hypothetical protein EDC04DRAFT_2518454, partial [Pisolithus marmoratus]